MNYTQRGKIENEARASQLRDFSGLRFGNITPTDIDGLIEYHGKCFVLIEAKLEGVEIPDGQRIALEVFCNDERKIGKPCVAIECKHNTPIGTSIDVANATVIKYFHNGKWKDNSTVETVRAFIDRFFEYVEKYF